MQQHGEERGGGGDRHERDEQASVADRANRGHRHDNEREQPDSDRCAAEDDGTPSGGHRGPDRRVFVGPAFSLLPPPHDDQQRVVDGDAQPDQRDDELHDERDLGDRRQRAQRQERGKDRDGGDEHRDQGGEACEHDHQHDQGAHPAEDRLDQDACATSAGVFVEGVDAGDADAGGVGGPCQCRDRLRVGVRGRPTRGWNTSAVAVRPSWERSVRPPRSRGTATRAPGTAAATRAKRRVASSASRARVDEHERGHHASGAKRAHDFLVGFEPRTPRCREGLRQRVGDCRRRPHPTAWSRRSMTQLRSADGRGPTSQAIYAMSFLGPCDAAAYTDHTGPAVNG